MNTIDKETVVYFQCNDWEPIPEAAGRFIYDYLEGELYDDQPTSVLKTKKEKDEWIKENHLCINTDIYDMSINYWVTTTREWLERNFPELLPYVSETPEPYMWTDDNKYYLKYTDENVGEWFLNEENSKEAYNENKHRFVEF